MAYVNGTTVEASASLPEAMTQLPEPNAHGEQFPPERLKQIQSQLAEPFDPGEIKWRVTATSTVQTKHGPQKRGQIVAYTDQRAYSDRLNEVFGEWGWTRHYDVQVAQNFERRAPGDKAQKAVSAKVVVVSKVTVHGLGSHTGVGEEWADNDNAATAAEAQAFKRACSVFGLGRYLYDIDPVWVDLDQYNRPAQTPNLPDWALPSYAQQMRREERERRTATNQPRGGIVQEETLANVRQLCNKVGYSLSQFVLRTYGGTTDVSKVGFARLTTIMERLTDIANGITRLGRAAEVLGPGRYETICKELNFASDSIDDIPDRNALRILVNRVEAEAASKQRVQAPRTTAPHRLPRLAAGCCRRRGGRRKTRAADGHGTGRDRRVSIGGQVVDRVPEGLGRRGRGDGGSSDREDRTRCKLKKVTLVTYGSCLAILVPAVGRVYFVGAAEPVLTGTELKTRNNRMKLQAAIAGLQALKESCPCPGVPR